MPMRHYGVLAGRAVAGRREKAAGTPHYQIHLVDQQGTSWRAAVNVKSQQDPPEVLYLAVEDFHHPLTDQLPDGPVGWSALVSQPDTSSVDYIRGDLFDRTLMRPLPPDRPGPEGDLEDFLNDYIQRAITEETVTVYAFGQRWGPERHKPDKVFGFEPGNGVHNIHMNQGNTGRFEDENGVFQDGALLLHLPDESRWIAIFLAFPSQSWNTDDATGQPI